MHYCGSDSGMAYFYSCRRRERSRLRADRRADPGAASGRAAGDAVEPTSEEVANPADLQGKPRSITHKFSILMFN